MQYHWVVCYDQETGEFSVDWDMTITALDGVVFDHEAAFGEGWSNPDEGTDSDKLYETLSIHLENTLDKNYEVV